MKNVYLVVIGHLRLLNDNLKIIEAYYLNYEMKMDENDAMPNSFLCQIVSQNGFFFNEFVIFGTSI